MSNSSRVTRGLNVTEQKMEKFYHVEKVVRIEMRNGQKYGVVKWQHFSHRENTLEPLSDLKQIVSLKDDIQRLEREFDLKDIQKDINKQIRRQTNEQLNKLYPLSEPPKKSKPEKRLTVSTYEQMKISVEVEKDIERRNKLGMKDLRPADYFYLLRVKFRIEDSIRQKIALKRIPETQYAITKVIGMQRCQQGFDYYIEMRDKIFKCEEQDMVELFPIQYLNYLNFATDFLKEHIGKEITEEKNLFKQRRIRQNSINYVKSVIAINQTLQAKKNPIFFGFNKDDAQRNRQRAEARRSMDDEQLSFDHIDPHSQLMKLYESIQKKSAEIRQKNRARTQKIKQKVAHQKRSLDKRSSETSKSEKDISEKAGSVSSHKKTPSKKSKSPEESRAKSPQSSPQSTPKAAPKSKPTPTTAVRRSQRFQEKKNRSASKKK